MNLLKRFIDKFQAFRVAKQAGRVRELAELKKGQRLKSGRSEKKPYEPGILGLSHVSAAIKKDHGKILNRRERKALAKAAFKRYLNQ
jgi:hypothetical protein